MGSRGVQSMYCWHIENTKVREIRSFFGISRFVTIAIVSPRV